MRRMRSVLFAKDTSRVSPSITRRRVASVRGTGVGVEVGTVVRVETGGVDVKGRGADVSAGVSEG